MWQEEHSSTYNYTNNESIKHADEQLQSELSELKKEVEMNEMAHGLEFLRPFTSVPQPVDPQLASLERKLYIEKLLNVHNIRKPYIQADVMSEQFQATLKDEYSNESLPLILHQVISYLDLSFLNFPLTLRIIKVAFA